MSKSLNFQIECPDCGKQYQAAVWRTLWGDGCTADNFTSRLTDDTNMVTCPHCGHTFRLPLALMYVDCQAGFAVWYEPQPDPGIDDETHQYASMFGANSYYAQAPRVKDWEEFKQTIRKYYLGELKANPITKFDIGALKQQNGHTANQQKKGGCMSMIMLVAIPITIVLILL